jgi:hypothetical protein
MAAQLHLISHNIAQAVKALLSSRRWLAEPSRPIAGE